MKSCQSDLVMWFLMSGSVSQRSSAQMMLSMAWSICSFIDSCNTLGLEADKDRDWESKAEERVEEEVPAIVMGAEDK